MLHRLLYYLKQNQNYYYFHINIQLYRIIFQILNANLFNIEDSIIIEQVVDYCQKAEAVHHNEIRELLEVHRDKLQLAVIESFKDRGFYWDSDAGYDSEVDETSDEEIESWPWSVIAIEEGWAEIAGDALIHFRSTAIYPDPDSCYRDPDTKELVFFGQVHATLVSRITVQVQVKVNVDSLRQNTLQMDELTVNDDRDIWFCDNEIEEIRRDSDTFDEMTFLNLSCGDNNLQE